MMDLPFPFVRSTLIVGPLQAGKPVLQPVYSKSGANATGHETYNCRSGVERTNDAVTDCGLGPRPRTSAGFPRAVSVTHRCYHQL